MRMPSRSNNGFTIQNSPDRLNSPSTLMSVGPASSGSTVPITCPNRASPASLLPKFFEPTKPGALMGMTGSPYFSEACRHTASMSSSTSAVTQVE